MQSLPWTRRSEEHHRLHDLRERGPDGLRMDAGAILGERAARRGHLPCCQPALVGHTVSAAGLTFGEAGLDGLEAPLSAIHDVAASPGIDQPDVGGAAWCGPSSDGAVCADVLPPLLPAAG